MKPDSQRTVLRATGLRVGYRSWKSEHVVLRDLSLQVKRGDLICLLGPNGVGKSSLLRTIAKVQPPLAGTIELDGVDMTRISPLELARKLGVVLTDRVEVGALPAYRIVELGRYAHLNWAGTPGIRDHEVVRWALTVVGAQHLATQDYNTLSDGERQRVMIARALAQEPIVLLLDEPTAFLDVASRVELMGLLRRLAIEEDLAIVLSTHDLELALRTADTMWLASTSGKFLVGAPEDVVLAGHVGEVFESSSVHFDPRERTFRLIPGSRGFAKVEGEGLPAFLAAAVLEREGYAIAKNGGATVEVTVTEGAKWVAVFSEHQKDSGESFAELAVCVRRGARGR